MWPGQRGAVTHTTHTHVFDVRGYAGVPRRRAGRATSGATRAPSAQNGRSRASYFNA